MIELIFQEIRHIFQAQKCIFLLSVLAFTCACIGINASLSNCLIAAQENTAAEISYGDKATYKIEMDGDSDTFNRVFGNPQSGAVKSLFDALKQSPEFTYRYTIENLVDFFDPDDASFGADDFPAFKEMFRVGYEDGSTMYYDDYLALKAIYADSHFCSDYGVTIESGRAFEPADFLVSDPETIVLPVLLGAEYSDLYAIGDRIENAHLGTIQKLTLEVVGFLKEGSYFYDNNTMKIMLDRYMILPNVETAYDGLQSDGSYDDFTHAAYDSLKILNTRLICDAANADRAASAAKKIFTENGFSELRLNAESENFGNFLESTRESAKLSIVITGFMILMISIIICIQTYYRIIQNRKKYSILMLNGITHIQLALLIVTETLLIFIFAAVLFFILKYLLRNVQTLDFGLSRYSVICIAAIEAILLVLIGFYGIRKVQQVDMSSVLREHE